MKLYIKNMVCSRCIAAVEKVFGEENLEISAINLGEVETKRGLNLTELRRLDLRLQDIGFERLEDSSQQFIEKVKQSVLLLTDSLDIPEDFILSKFLAGKLNREYSSISKLFSQNANVTLEQYFILQKIEKAKELLLYGEFSLTEISGKLGYRSVQHLSSQFKNSTGFTPSGFKKLKVKNRIPLDKI